MDFVHLAWASKSKKVKKESLSSSIVVHGSEN